jgi:hypothetical protein
MHFAASGEQHFSVEPRRPDVLVQNMVDVVDKASYHCLSTVAIISIRSSSFIQRFQKRVVGWRQFFAIRTQNGSRGIDLSPGTFNKVVRLAHPARRP